MSLLDLIHMMSMFLCYRRHHPGFGFLRKPKKKQWQLTFIYHDLMWGRLKLFMCLPMLLRSQKHFLLITFYLLGRLNNWSFLTLSNFFSNYLLWSWISFLFHSLAKRNCLSTNCIQALKSNRKNQSAVAICQTPPMANYKSSGWGVKTCQFSHCRSLSVYSLAGPSMLQNARGRNGRRWISTAW